jgi:hypothetical protein
MHPHSVLPLLSVPLLLNPLILEVMGWVPEFLGSLTALSESETFWGRQATSGVDLRVGAGSLGGSKAALIRASGSPLWTSGTRIPQLSHCLPQNVSLS